MFGCESLTNDIGHVLLFPLIVALVNPKTQLASAFYLLVHPDMSQLRSKMLTELSCPEEFLV